jgi:DNA-binding PadR family transcriptional regulator
LFLANRDDPMADHVLPPAEFRVLLALLDGPKHGHGIRIDVRERTGGRVDMGPGTLYGAIKRLAERGWIAEVPAPAGKEGDERRRYYEVTPGGRDAAGNEAARMRELLGIARAKKLRPAGGG